MVDVSGSFSSDFARIEGRVNFSGCNDIRLQRVSGTFPPPRDVEGRKLAADVRPEDEAAPAGRHVAAETFANAVRGLNLDGEWSIFTAHFRTSSLSRRAPVRVTLRPETFQFTRQDEDTIAVRRSDLTETEELGIPRDETLVFRRPSGVEIFPNVIGQVIRNANGVTLLGGRNGVYAVRFAPIPEVDETASAALPQGFCPRAIGLLEADLRSAADETERLVGTQDALGVYNTQRGAQISLVNSAAFGRVFGAPPDEISQAQYDAVIERLKYCGIFYWDNIAAQMLASALFNDAPLGTMRGFLRSRAASFDDPTIITVLTHMLSSRLYAARGDSDDFEREIQQAYEITDPEERDDALRSLFDRYAEVLPPSVIRPAVERFERERLAEEQRQIELARQERLANAPTPPTEHLVYEATRQYFLRNCDRAFFAVQAVDSGSDKAIFSTFAARSITPVDGFCEVDMGPQLMSLGVGSISNLNCMDGDPKTCEFFLFWSCRFRINPEFGFTQDVPDFDPVCPILSIAPILMVGRYTEQDRLTWTARNIEF